MNDEKKQPTAPEAIPKEQYLRLAADFDNYRKAMERQVAEAVQGSVTRTALPMIDIFDLLEQAVTHAPPEVIEAGEWFSGIEKVQQQFLTTLEKFSITRIPTAGQPFDPVTMEAVSVVEGSEESQKVKEEVRAGWRMYQPASPAGGRVVRPARVIIYK